MSDVTASCIAQLNVGVLQAPLDSPQLADFVANLGRVNAIADAAPGFVWRLRDADGSDATSLRPRGPDLLVNMSVWQTLEALRAFAYRNGPHLEMLRRRREFFRTLDEAHQVLWWIPQGHIPGLDEAFSRLDMLRRDGSGPGAFTFREPYPPPVTVAATRATRAR
jgi:Domain of unknown function (DUF3291)